LTKPNSINRVNC